MNKIELILSLIPIVMLITSVKISEHKITLKVLEEYCSKNVSGSCYAFEQWCKGKSKGILAYKYTVACNLLNKYVKEDISKHSCSDFEKWCRKNMKIKRT